VFRRRHEKKIGPAKSLPDYLKVDPRFATIFCALCKETEITFCSLINCAQTIITPPARNEITIASDLDRKQARNPAHFSILFRRLHRE
jgi:hypothetical protein